MPSGADGRTQCNHLRSSMLVSMWCRMQQHFCTESHGLHQLHPCAGAPARPGTTRASGRNEQHEDWDEYEDENDEDEEEEDQEGAYAKGSDWRAMLQGITGYNPQK